MASDGSTNSFYLFKTHVDIVDCVKIRRYLHLSARSILQSKSNSVLKTSMMSDCKAIQTLAYYLLPNEQSATANLDGKALR